MKIKLAQNRSGVSAMVLSFGHLDIYLHVIIFQVFHSRSPPTKFGPNARSSASTLKRRPKKRCRCIQNNNPMTVRRSLNRRENRWGWPDLAGFGMGCHGKVTTKSLETHGFLTMKSRGFLANVTSHHPIL